ncbi:MAG: Ig-like domain-containing protein [Deltaproteobacteria bacterium]|nr:Ig-like domain-containing protein [Deltaproteobacteria bacterium]
MRRCLFNLYKVSLIMTIIIGPGCGSDDWNDDTGPTVVRTEPEEGATGVRLTAPVKITFDEELSSNTLTPKVILMAGSTPGSISYDAAYSVLTIFPPDPPLDPGTKVDLVIKSSITDVHGHKLVVRNKNGVYVPGDFHLDYTLTSDVEPPVLLSTSPKEGSRDIALTTPFEAVFSEDLDPASLGKGAIGAVSGDKPVPTILQYFGSTDEQEAGVDLFPIDAWPAKADIKVTISGNVSDTAGNKMGKDQVIVFSTAGD